MMTRAVNAVKDATLWACLALASNGCTRYVALADETPAPAQWAEVRAHLLVPTEYPAGRLTVGDAVILAGQVLEPTDREIVLSLFWVGSASGVRHPAQGEKVTVPRENLERLEVKRSAPVPTAVIIGSVVLAGVLVPITIFSNSTGPNDGGENNGETPTFPRRSR